MRTETKKQDTTAPSDPSSSKILRFRTSERLMHWALAIPFLVCFGSALVLLAYFNPDPTRPYRYVFAATHRISALALIVLPILAIIIKGDIRTHFNNISQAFFWTLHDIKWLLLLGLAAVNKKITLPEQGKFNAAEKINIMNLLFTYPLYIVTGFLIWKTDAAFVPWLIHCSIAAMALPLVFGHIYMATINAGSRVGLSGMFSGYVDRHWAKHQYPIWFREHFEDKNKVIPITAAERGRMKSHEKVTPPDDVDSVAQEVLASLKFGTPGGKSRSRGIPRIPVTDSCLPEVSFNN